MGDKSGNAGVYGVRNDIGVIWPSKGDPIVMTIMSMRPGKDDEPDDKLIAQAAEAAVAEPEVGDFPRSGRSAGVVGRAAESRHVAAVP